MRSLARLVSLDDSVTLVGLGNDQLQELLTAQDRQSEAEHAYRVATTEFYGTVRRLQIEGASFRDLGVALGLSHQRVHQIVTTAGGGRPWSRTADGVVACSFCGRKPEDVAKVVAGDSAYICSGCILVAKDLLVSGRQAVVDGATIRLGGQERRSRKCNFCNKRRSTAASVVSRSEAALICVSCLDLCREVLDLSE